MVKFISRHISCVFLLVIYADILSDIKLLKLDEVPFIKYPTVWHSTENWARRNIIVVCSPFQFSTMLGESYEIYMKGIKWRIPLPVCGLPLLATSHSFQTMLISSGFFN